MLNKLPPATMGGEVATTVRVLWKRRVETGQWVIDVTTARAANLPPEHTDGCVSAIYGQPVYPGSLLETSSNGRLRHSTESSLPSQPNEVLDRSTGRPQN